MTELVLALDVLEKERALAIVQECAPHIDAIKLGYPVILSCGLAIADEMAEHDLPLIADFKVADIPSTNRLIAEQVFDAGFSSIICHGFTGKDSVRACVETAFECGGACYVVAEMSHPGATDFFHGGTAEHIARMAVDCGADGIIAPATRPDRVRVLRGIAGNRKILSPGIGAQGGDARAVAALVDGIIVGRAIYEAEDPRSAAQSYAGLRAHKK